MKANNSNVKMNAEKGFFKYVFRIYFLKKL